MDLVYFWRALLKRKWLILISSLLAASAAFILTKNQPKKYKSITQISTGFSVTDEISLNDNANSFLEADTKFNNAIFTILSPSVLNLLSYQLILNDLQSKTPFRNPSENVFQDLSISQFNSDSVIRKFNDKLLYMEPLNSYLEGDKQLLKLLSAYEYDTKSLRENVNIYRLDRTDYIQIEFVSENPQLSAFLANTLFREFIRYYRTLKSVKSKESIDTLASIVAKKKDELDRKNALIKGEGLIDVDMGNKSNLELIATLEKSLSEENNKRTNLYYSIRKINQRILQLENTLPKTTSNQNIENNDELVSLRNSINETYKEYINTGSTDQTLLSRYNKLKSEYQKKVNSLQQSNEVTDNAPKDDLLLTELRNQKKDIEFDIEASNENINFIQTKINSLKGNIQTDASKEMTVESMLKDIDLANKEYIEAQKRYNEAIDINSSSVNNFRQILLGQPPLQPEPSKRLLIVFASGICVLIISSLLILLFTFLDNSLKTPDIFKKTLNLHLICMINQMDMTKKTIGEIVLDTIDEPDPNKRRRNNVFRESLRKLRYEVEASGKRIILFTSTKKSQGKTTLIQALSYSMSQKKKKILIIDTNFNNNDLTVSLDALPVLQQITEIDLGQTKLYDQISTYTKDIGVGTVFIIGSEPGDWSPSEVLPSHNILENLSQLLEIYDYIFLEGPPLNDFSDSKELSQYVEGVIAIFSAKESIKQIDKESVRYFTTIQDKFIGAVLNKVDLTNVNVS